MTSRTITSFALGFIFISALYSTANGQTASYVADTGVIDLAPGQSLRVSAAASGSESITVQFNWMEYVETGFTNGVSRRVVSAQTTTGPMTLSNNQCLVFYLGGNGASVRVQLYTSSHNLKANAFVISPATGGSNGSSSLPMEQISFNFTNITFE